MKDSGLFLHALVTADEQVFCRGARGRGYNHAVQRTQGVGVFAAWARLRCTFSCILAVAAVGSAPLTVGVRRSIPLQLRQAKQRRLYVKMSTNLAQLSSELLETVAREASLAPVLRKAIRLADLAGEKEYRLLFEMHLAGYDASLKGRAVGIRGWKEGEVAKWRFGEAFMHDRSDRGGGVSLSPWSRSSPRWQRLRERSSREFMSYPGHKSPKPWCGRTSSTVF